MTGDRQRLGSAPSPRILARIARRSIPTVNRHHSPGWTSGFLSGIAAVALIAVLIAALVVPANIGLSRASAQDDSTPETATTGQSSATMDAVDVVQRVSPAVVTVYNEQTGVLGAQQTEPQTAGVGTGFIIDEDGRLVTNWHVVQGGDEFFVLLADGERRDAELVGLDPRSDLAVLDMEGDVPATVPFGDSDALEPGQTVIAIGSPLGTFTTTVTQGIVSGLGRDFPQTAPQAESPQIYNNLIQHDAAINPGNSGGPLFNMDGEVVGVNTLGITETGGAAVAQGLFFAVPSSTVQEVVSEITETGEVIYPYFGVGSFGITPQIAAQADLPVDFGAAVLNVDPESGAGEAGIQEGDIILEIAGQEINQENPFTEVLFNHEPGETVEVLIQRGDEQLTVEVTLGESAPIAG